MPVVVKEINLVKGQKWQDLKSLFTYHRKVATPVACPERWNWDVSRSPVEVNCIMLGMDNSVKGGYWCMSNIAQGICCRGQLVINGRVTSHSLTESKHRPVITDRSIIGILRVWQSSITEKVLSNSRVFA
jgi:hypothetical protein